MLFVPGSPPPQEEHQIRRRRRGLLRMYYGVDEHGASLQEEDPLDIDLSAFKPDAYLEKLLKDSSLTVLYKQEERMKKGML